MKRPLIIGIVVLVVVIVGGYLIFHKNPAKTPAVASSTSTSQSTSTPPSSSSSSSSTSPMSVTVNANDDSASPETINAVKGQVVHLTFAVSTNGTYHGGLEFKSSSPSIDSGNIAEGSSKTVSFTATQSFQFTPFWYASDVQKDYFVTVKVT